MAQRRDLKAMAKPNEGLGPLGQAGLRDTRSFPKTRPPNPTGEPRIGPTTQGDLNADAFDQMQGLLGVHGITDIEGLASPAAAKFAKFFSERYPRIADKVQRMVVEEMPKGVKGATESLPLREMPDRTNNPAEVRAWLKQSRIAVDPNQTPAEMADSILHESSHVAGAARDTNYVPKYNQLLEHVPYELHPEEIKAVRRAKAITPSFMEADRLGTTPKAMQQGRGAAKVFQRKANAGLLPGSMSEFSPVGAGAPPDLDFEELIKELSLRGLLK